MEKRNTDPSKRPSKFGDLYHANVSSSEFKYNKGIRIFGETEPADYIYQVVEGAVRSHKLLSDGRRQIGAFHLPGDIFGLENSDFHRFTAEASPKRPFALLNAKAWSASPRAIQRRFEPS